MGRAAAVEPRVHGPEISADELFPCAGQEAGRVVRGRFVGARRNVFLPRSRFQPEPEVVTRRALRRVALLFVEVQVPVDVPGRTFVRDLLDRNHRRVGVHRIVGIQFRVAAVRVVYAVFEFKRSAVADAQRAVVFVDELRLDRGDAVVGLDPHLSADDGVGRCGTLLFVRLVPIGAEQSRHAEGIGSEKSLDEYACLVVGGFADGVFAVQRTRAFRIGRQYAQEVDVEPVLVGRGIGLIEVCVGQHQIVVAGRIAPVGVVIGAVGVGECEVIGIGLSAVSAVFIVVVAACGEGRQGQRGGQEQ